MAQKLFDKASLVMIPSQYKEGKIYNIKPEDQSSSFEFERGSAATRVNSDGLIEYVDVGEELATATNWVNGPTYDTNTGTLTATNLTSNTSIDVNIENNETYLITYTIVSITSTGAGVRTLLGGSGGSVQDYRNQTGTYREVVTYPSGASVDKLYFSVNGTTSFEITDISLKQISNDTPRLDYSGTEPSLLLEPERRNLYPNSGDFTTWSRYNNIPYEVSNENVISGEKSVIFDWQDTNTFIRLLGQTFTGTHTTSMYIKPLTLKRLQFNYTIINKGAIFDFNSNSVVSNTGTAASIEDVGDGWYRLISTADLTGASNSQLRVSLPSNIYAGTAHVSGFQQEAGSYATSYIPTNGQTETRLADVCEGGGDASVFNDSEGTLYLELKYPELDYLSGFITISDGTTSDRIVLYMNQQGYKFYIQELGAIFTDSNLDVSQYFKVAVKYKSGDNAMFINGSKVGTTNTSTLSSISGLDRIEFQNPDGAEKMKGNVKSLHYFPEALTDTELQQLTSNT